MVSFEGQQKFIHIRCFCHGFYLLHRNPVMNRDQKGVNIGFLQIKMLFGPVDPLHIQQINLGATVSGEKLQFFFLQKLFALFPHGGKIIKVQRKIVIKQGDRLTVF